MVIREQELLERRDGREFFRELATSGEAYVVFAPQIEMAKPDQVAKALVATQLEDEAAAEGAEGEAEEPPA